ncbi:MAG: Na+/H+ antiporter [Pseudoxanthomonas sp.]
MASLELVLAMLLAVVASGYLVRMLPFALPLPLAQIALGAIIEGVFQHGVTLEPDIFFLLFLPPLLFLDGWRIPKEGLFRDKAVILELAFGLVLFTVVGAGFMIHWLLPMLPLPVAFALAAIVAPTDPVALSSITKRVPMPRRLLHILEGESLLNDATGLVCFRFAVAAAVTGQFSLATASLTFIWVALAGIAAGAAVTAAIAWIQRFLVRRFGEESSSPILINLLTPFGAYLVGERIGASGILAAVAAGITMSYVELNGRALASTRVQRTAVWDTVQFTLNGVMFVLLGEQLPDIVKGAIGEPGSAAAIHPFWLIMNALAISFGLVLLRFVWVWVSLRISLFKSRALGHAETPKPRFRLVLATSLAGVRGGITMAGILTLPFVVASGAPFPGRHLAIFMATAVIVVSLVLASVALPRLLRGLELPDANPVDAEEDLGRRAATLAAIARLDNIEERRDHDHPNAEIHENTLSHILANYRHRLDGGAATSGDREKMRVADQTEQKLRLTALQAERDALTALVKERKISDETGRKLIREVDLVEARYR